MDILQIGTIVGVRKPDVINSYRRFWKIVADPIVQAPSGQTLYSVVRCTVNGKEFSRTTMLNAEYFEPSPNRSFIIEVIGFCTHRDKVAGDPLVATLKRRIKNLTKRMDRDMLLLDNAKRELATLEKESSDGK